MRGIPTEISDRRQCDDCNSYKIKYLIRVAHLQFRTSVHYHHDGCMPEDTQADMVLVQ